MFRDLLRRNPQKDLNALGGRGNSQRVESPDQASQDNQPSTDQKEQFEFRDGGRTQNCGRPSLGRKQTDEGGTKQSRHKIQVNSCENPILERFPV